MTLFRFFFNFTNAYFSPTFSSNFVSRCQTWNDM